jgi:glycolate oxidase FAD binding subunit
VRLAELQVQLARAGQRLSLDPPELGATLGGIVAAAASGPLRHRFGAPRDLLLGITVVLADGTVAKAGGKVVKNVAGYDLGKLFAGSLGTLGVVVEVVFRLHPLPEARALSVVTLETPEAAAAALQALLRSTLVPSAVELHRETGPVRLGILFEGRRPGIAAQLDTTRTLLGGLGGVSIFEGALGDAEWGCFVVQPAADLRLQIASLPADLAFTLRAIDEVAGQRHLAARVSGRAGLGVLQASFTGGDAGAHVSSVRALRERLRGRDASVVIRHASAEVRRGADVFGDVGDALPLMRRVKDRFDPARILSPGRFVTGA